MPKCRINGVEVEVPQGATIIEAFKKSGQELAYYCWHPGLSVAGVCRMCMVTIEGNPRLQIACNTQVTEGMVVSNQTEDVKTAVKWTLDFHLINHPLDCPICDQAGECGLQEFYMKHGKYTPEMSEHKTKKRKVIDLGPTVVLDSERCILCSRCVRFTEEVTKTNELGIFNRGDHSEVGTFADKPLHNKYSTNVVDICPVGALTSKDFRFKQRVWYLKDLNSICTGCSTGCNVKAYYNEKGFFRVKPVENMEVNTYWMCDEGRDMYKHVNKEFRQLKAEFHEGAVTKEMAAGAAAKQVGQLLKDTKSKYGSEAIGLVLTGQYTCEEYSDILGTFTRDLGSKNIFHWINNPEKMEDFDGLLLRGDKNPNTKGLQQELEKAGINIKEAAQNLRSAMESGKIKTLVVAGPEWQVYFPDLEEKAKLFSKVENVIWLTANPHASFGKIKWVIPMKTSVEKKGSYINFKGLKQTVKQSTTVVSEALTLSEAASLFSGKEVTVGGFL